MPRSQSYVDQQNRAEILYRKGNYSTALKAFDAILEKWPIKDAPLVLLDWRTATLIKLKRYDEAMKEARKMIKLDKTVSSGYLRCGQILRLQEEGKQTEQHKQAEQDKKALKIYELGLASVSDPAATKILLERIVELRKCIVPDGAKDWLMTALPMEILQLILDKLEFREMVQLQRVSQTWRNVLVNMTSLWRDIDVRVKRGRGVNHKTLEAYGQRSQWIFSSLKLSHLAPGSFRMLLSRSRSVDTCLLNNTLSTKDLISCFPTIMATKSLQRLEIRGACLQFPRAFMLLNALPNLVSIDLEIDSAPNELVDNPDHRISARMQHLRFRHQAGARPYHLGNLLVNAVNLETFDLAGCLYGQAHLQHLQRLRTADLDTAWGIDYIHFPDSVERISVDCGKYNLAAVPPAHLEKGRLSRLQSLIAYAGQHSGDPPQLLDLLLESGTEIEQLALGAIPGDVYTVLMQMFRDGHFPMLGNLTLGMSSEMEIQDHDLAEIALHCPQLTSCRFMDALSITGSGIRSLVERTKRLKYLSLVNTPNVSLDAVEWARNQGIRVISRSRE